jgi:CheY-like chemotaxis protein
VEQIGGKIWLLSELNRGSTFGFSIPIKVDARTEVQKLTQNIDLKPDLNKKTILVVEDEPKNAHLLNIILEDINAEVINACDGIEALDSVKVKMPDLILMDIHMPRMDGIEATRRIRMMDQQVPIIAQTAYAYEDDEEKCMQAGCVAYITKPIRKKELVDKILQFIRPVEM